MRILIFSWYFIFSISCNAPKNLADQCNIPARVVKSDLDGCPMFLVLSDGTKLLPVNYQEMKLDEEYDVMISYMVQEDAVSICMAEDAIVIITCWQLAGRIPRKKECEDITEPFKSEWLSEVMKQIDPVIVEKYDYRDGFAYVCKTASYDYIYDCQGTLLCAFETGTQSPCNSKKQELSNKIEIWVKHR
jgi:hypothetical protein